MQNPPASPLSTTSFLAAAFMVRCSLKPIRGYWKHFWKHSKRTIPAQKLKSRLENALGYRDKSELWKHYGNTLTAYPTGLTRTPSLYKCPLKLWATIKDFLFSLCFCSLVVATKCFSLVEYLAGWCIYLFTSTPIHYLENSSSGLISALNAWVPCLSLFCQG